jgi:ABC-type phosphate transport system substrate-binding protein
LILLSLIVAGCPAGKTVTEEKVVIRGSNTIGEELAPRLIAEYKKEHSAVVFDLESKGTGYGLGNLLAGGCEIAAACKKKWQPKKDKVQATWDKLCTKTK